MTPTQKKRPLRYSLNIFQKWLPYWIFVFRCKVFLAKDNTSAAIPTNYLLNLLGYETESFCAESRNSRWHFLEPSQIKNPTMQHSRKKENDMLWNTRCYRELLIVIFMATFFFSLKTALFFMVLTFFNLKVYCIAVWFFCLPFFFLHALMCAVKSVGRQNPTKQQKRPSTKEIMINEKILSWWITNKNTKINKWEDIWVNREREFEYLLICFIFWLVFR